MDTLENRSFYAESAIVLNWAREVMQSALSLRGEQQAGGKGVL